MQVRFRGFGSLLLVGLLSGAALVSSATSCSGPDPGLIEFSERPKGSSGALDSPEGGTGGEAGTTKEGGAGEAGSEGGASSSGDPVFGTTTFAAGPAGPPVRVAKAANPAHGGDASGKDCIVGGCHLDTRPWAFGGTLYTDAAGTARVPMAEIRITGPDAKVYASTYTDVDGNFWFETGTPTVPANSRVGVRIAGKFMDMAGTNGGAQVGCQKAAGCHGAGTPGKVFLK